MKANIFKLLECFDVNECDTVTDACKGAHGQAGTCVNKPRTSSFSHGYTCECLVGTALTNHQNGGPTCENIDECSTG